MGDLVLEMVEIVEMEERVVPINYTESKTTKITKLDEQVEVAPETTTGNKEKAATGNANTTEGAPQSGTWEV